MSVNPCSKCNASNRISARFCSNCGEPLVQGVSPKADKPVEAVALSSGTMLQGRYRIEGELGRGGFGAVYRAWDSNLNKPCALKENLDISPEAQRQFEREATVLARLTHPHLPRVTDHFTITGQGQYLVMDYVDGEDLASLVQRQGTLPVEQALVWVSQVADALEYLHNQRPAVVHRDIKPANIRITTDKKAVLVDFGLVKLYDPRLRTTLGARAVTPGYAPPEQYGRSSTDARTDIYALGATLYTLLTGQEPLESVQRMTGGHMRPVDQVNPQISSQVTHAVDRAMQLSPERRCQSAEEFKTALQVPATVAVQAVHPSSYQRPAAQAPATSPPRLWSKPGIIFFGVAGILVLCLGLMLALGSSYIGGQQDREWAQKAETTVAFVRTQTAVNSQPEALVAQASVTKNISGIAQAATSTSSAQETAQARERAATHAQATGVALTARAQGTYAAMTAEAQATRSVQETAVTQDGLVLLNSAKTWPLTIGDSFDNNSNGWSTGSKEGSFANIAWTIVNGKYRWEAKANDGFVWRVRPNMNFVSDFYLAVDVQQIKSPMGAGQGVVFRDSGETGYYYFKLSEQDQYSVKIHYSDAWETLIPWTTSSAILPGQLNRIAVVAQGRELAFFINDRFVADITDERILSGDVGLAVGLSDAGQEAAWEFDNFELRVP